MPSSSRCRSLKPTTPPPRCTATIRSARPCSTGSRSPPTSVTSATGQRYLNGSSMKLLFVRQQKSDELGTSPYLFLGPAHYVQHTGDRPIAIVWRLDYALPSEFFAAATVAAS